MRVDGALYLQEGVNIQCAPRIINKNAIIYK